MRTLDQFWSSGCSLPYSYGIRSEMIKSWKYNIKSCNLILSHNQKADRWCTFGCGFGPKTSNCSLPFDRCRGHRAPMHSSCSAYNLLEMEHSVLLFPCGKLFLKSCETKHSSTVLGSMLKSHVSLCLSIDQFWILEASSSDFLLHFHSSTW